MEPISFFPREQMGSASMTQGPSETFSILPLDNDSAETRVIEIIQHPLERHRHVRVRSRQAQQMHPEPHRPCEEALRMNLTDGKTAELRPMVAIAPISL